MKKPHTGERLETTIFNGNTINHLHRYALALKLTKNKIVLDIASGEGYGSHFMSNDAEFVYGVDIDKESIEQARFKYKKNNLEFILGTTSEIPLKDKSIDIVVSFETLEHHNEHEQMMTEIMRILKPNGQLLISTPDKYYYSDIRNYNNPFHVKELYKSEFIDLITKNFKKHKMYSQSYINKSSLIIDDSRRINTEFYTGDFLNLKTITSYPNFLIALCSNFEVSQLGDSIFDGHQLIEDNEIENRINAIYNSNTYKLGHLILHPLKLLKRNFKFWK